MSQATQFRHRFQEILCVQTLEIITGKPRAFPRPFRHGGDLSPHMGRQVQGTECQWGTREGGHRHYGWLKNHVTVKVSVLFLTTLPTLKACNSPHMQYYFKRGFLHCSEVIFSFLIKKSRQKAVEIEIAFFHPLRNPMGRTLDHLFYASHIRHNFPYKLIPISMS